MSETPKPTEMTETELDEVKGGGLTYTSIKPALGSGDTSIRYPGVRKPGIRYTGIRYDGARYSGIRK